MCCGSCWRGRRGFRSVDVTLMAKIKNPTTLSAHFGIDPAKLSRLGVLDVTLAVDTKLFIDPLLLERSKQAEINKDASQDSRKHFESIIKFLQLTQRPDDMAWRTARKLLEFHEIRGTCLGYGVSSIGGSGFGRELTRRVLSDGKEIVDLGVHDPDLFAAMALLEEDIGADRISDMTTNVIRKALIAFNRRVLKELGLKGEAFDIGGPDGLIRWAYIAQQYVNKFRFALALGYFMSRFRGEGRMKQNPRRIHRT